MLFSGSAPICTLLSAWILYKLNSYTTLHNHLFTSFLEKLGKSNWGFDGYPLSQGRCGENKGSHLDGVRKGLSSGSGGFVIVGFSLVEPLAISEGNAYINPLGKKRAINRIRSRYEFKPQNV